MSAKVVEQFRDRTKQWWRAKAGFLFSLLTFHLVWNNTDALNGAILLALAMIAVFGIGTLGHLINDWSDMADDRRAGKANTMALIPPAWRFIAVALAIVLGHLPWFIGFSITPAIVVLLAAESLLFCMYSVPPLKLKRRPEVAVFLDALYAFIAPSLFLWLSFDASCSTPTDLYMVATLVGWALPMGLRHVLLHHISDRNNDLLANIPNLANRYGVGSLLRLTRAVLVPVEMVFHVLFLAYLYKLAVPTVLPLLTLYSMLVLHVALSKLPYISLGLAKLPLDPYYTRIMGLVNLIWLSAQDGLYVLVLVSFLLMFTDVLHHMMLQSVLKNLIQRIWNVGSLTANWGVYYFRKIMLRWPEEKNWGRHYEKHLRDAMLEKRPAIAMFNHSYDRFSGDYLVQKFSPIDHRLYFYHGSPRPLNEKGKGNLMGNDEILRKLKYALLNFVNADIRDLEDEQIAKSLLGQKVKLIVTHSGKMGNELLDVARKTNIPLIVIFHATDILCEAMENRNIKEIDQLFSQAALLVGTSKEICCRLEDAGCPKDKIGYLPNFLDPELLNMHCRGSNGNMFITVGRHSPTRAPYLVILSFKEVIRKLPDAKLMIVGLEMEADVTEVCRVMIKALGLKDSVSFIHNSSYSEVVKAMSRADVFVQHFVTEMIHGEREGTPLAVLMAMAMGLPVVASRNGGIGELITDGETGLLTDEFDYMKMAEKMVQMAQDETLRLTVIENAHKVIKNERMVGSGIEVFSQMVDACVNPTKARQSAKLN